MMKRILVIAFLLQLFHSSYCGTPTQWKSRTIYQLLTDRFGRSDNSTNGCGNLYNYCGGTFDGIINHLDYIQQMGFNAIWISPVVSNTPGGYHGYWAQNIYTINSYFGGDAGFRRFIDACHQRGIWVMIDIVANHMGNVGYDYSSLYPFNSASHYHDCNGCNNNCSIDNFKGGYQVEHCRLAGLPDLNQTNDGYVRQTLLSWIKSFVSNYSIDGLRIDTVPEVSYDFWGQFQQASGVYCVGEVFDGDPSFVSSYQGVLNSLLSYPMYYTIKNVWGYKQSMNQIQSQINNYKVFKDISILGTFVDNHDNPRFLNFQGDYNLYKSSITFVLTSFGIPIIYYGTEQGFGGGDDPKNREVLWTTKYSTSHPLFTHISTVNAYRNKANIGPTTQIQRYSDDNFYAYTRGTDTLVCLTNVGSNGGTVQRNITYHPWSEGTKLTNIFYPNSDFIYVSGGKLQIYLLNGESKVYYVNKESDDDLSYLNKDDEAFPYLNEDYMDIINNGL